MRCASSSLRIQLRLASSNRAILQAQHSTEQKASVNECKSSVLHQSVSVVYVATTTARAEVCACSRCGSWICDTA